MTMKYFRYLIVCSFFFVSGCWDMKDIRETHYVTAIGIDYKQQEYSIFAQMLNFRLLSKSEGGSGEQKAAYVGNSSSSSSLEMAFSNLLRSSQWRTSWSMISSVLLSEKAIKNLGGLFFWDLISRHPEIRHTAFIFGTQEPMNQVLLAEPLYGASPKHTILQEPQDNYRQNSYIKPISLYDYARQMTEPAQTVLLPSIGIDKSSWRDKESSSSKPFFNGAYLFYKRSCKGWLSLEDLKGFGWFQKEAEKMSLVVSRDGSSPDASIVLKNRGVRIISLLNENAYDTEIKLAGTILERNDKLTNNEIEALAAKKVEQEIRETFSRALTMDVDVFSLEHAFYKQHLRQWKVASETKRKVQEGSLRNVIVSVSIESTGMNK